MGIDEILLEIDKLPFEEKVKAINEIRLKLHEISPFKNLEGFSSSKSLSVSPSTLSKLSFSENPGYMGIRERKCMGAYIKAIILPTWKYALLSTSTIKLLVAISTRAAPKYNTPA